MSEINELTTYITNAGRALQAKLTAARATMQYTRAAVGRGRAPEGIPYASLTDLIEPIEGAGAYIADKRYSPGNPSADITVQVTLGTHTEGFYYTEVGLFALDPDEGEVMVAYMSRYQYPAVVFPGGIGTISETTMVIAMVDIADAKIESAPAAIVTYQGGDQRYAQKQHRHFAAEVEETTGETVEEAQRRQDTALEGMAQVTGTAQFERSFATPGMVSLWAVYEGILDGGLLTTGGEG